MIYLNRSTYIIGSLDSMNKSKRTFDLDLFEIANDESICNTLGLWCPKPVHFWVKKQSYEEIGYSFVIYLLKFRRSV